MHLNVPSNVAIVATKEVSASFISKHVKNAGHGARAADKGMLVGKACEWTGILASVVGHAKGAIRMKNCPKQSKWKGMLCAMMATFFASLHLFLECCLCQKKNLRKHNALNIQERE
jgi:hypothetical protein